MRCLLDGVSLCATAAQQGAGHWNRPSGLTGSVSYEIQSANSNRNNPYGGTTTISSSAARVTHDFGTSLTVKFRVRTKVGSATSAWVEYTS